MMKTRKIYLFIITVLFSQVVLAANDYDQYAKAIRDSIWAWDKPEFKNYTVPDKYKNESAVILALHEEVHATGNNRIRFTGKGLIGIGLNKELNYMHIYRKVIKLNDKKALTDNAEVEFKESEKTIGINSQTIYKSVVGVRVIKPDGTIKEVDVSEAVSITEGKKEKESNKKLAVSNLEVGDILDIFFHESGRIDHDNIPEQTFTFASRYPILSYSVHCELSKSLTNEYHLLNGAPDFIQSTNEDEDVVLDVKQTDIQKLPVEKWLSPYRQFPIIRLSVLYNSNKKIYKPASSRSKGLYKNLSSEKILEDAVSVYNSSFYYTIVKDLNKQIKKHIKKNPKIDKKQLAEYINQAFLYEAQNFYRINYRTYLATMEILFSKYKIDYKIGFVTDRTDTRYDDANAYWDYYVFLAANQNSQIFESPRRLFHKGQDERYEGETAQLFVPKKRIIKYSDSAKRSQMTIPVSTADQNADKSELTVRFSESDFLTLDIDRKVSLTGHQINERYSDLILRKEWRDAMAHWLGEKTELELLKEKASKNKKAIESYEASLEKEKKEREDAVKKEINFYHDIDTKELKEFSFPALGVTPDESQMIYNVKYTIDGLVKRAGNNYILDAGKLIGSQLTLNESERKRSIDVYMPYARSYEHEIKVEIPAGYTAENIDALNKTIDNSCGTFTSSVSVDGSTLVIKTKKVYKSNYEPATNWDKLVEMLDVANEFYSQSIVLKK